MVLVKLGECPSGLFVFEGRCLGFKSKYKTENQSCPGVFQSDAYVVASGEYFWGGASDSVARENLMALPLAQYLVGGEA